MKMPPALLGIHVLTWVVVNTGALIKFIKLYTKDCPLICKLYLNKEKKLKKEMEGRHL